MLGMSLDMTRHRLMGPHKTSMQFEPYGRSMIRQDENLYVSQAAQHTGWSDSITLTNSPDVRRDHVRLASVG